MKQVLIFLFLSGIINCDKLDNTYLPPNNAQSAAGNNVIQPPAVADLRTRSTLISGQYTSPNIPSDRYPSPDVQNFPPNRQYLPSNGQNSGAEYQRVSSLQHSSPNGQNSGARYQNQYSSTNVPSGNYPLISGQSSYTRPNVLPSVPSSQYHSSNGPSAQYSGKNSLFSGSTGPNKYAEPASQYGTPISHNSVPSFPKQESDHQHQGNVNPIAILRSTSIPNAGYGSYQYSYETENGISAEEEGSLVNDAGTARGGYSYTSPEGENIVVEYVADENGFRAKGSHIPEIPEAIQKSIELNKAAAARDGNQGSQYQYRGLSDAPKAPSQAEYQYQGLDGAPEALNTQYRASPHAGHQYQELNGEPKAPNSHYGAVQRIPSQSDIGLSGGSSYQNQGSSFNSPPSINGFAHGRFGVQDSQGGYKY